jgi:hypothetical protein
MSMLVGGPFRWNILIDLISGHPQSFLVLFPIENILSAAVQSWRNPTVCAGCEPSGSMLFLVIKFEWKTMRIIFSRRMSILSSVGCEFNAEEKLDGKPLSSPIASSGDS